tara:strand:- start:282 stop:716 length:435 start_codon:yes stop_codon:yes gene_type:complete
MMYPLTVTLSVTNHDQHLKLLSILGEPKVEVSAPDETPAPAPKKRARKAQPVKSADSKEARHVEAAAAPKPKPKPEPKPEPASAAKLLEEAQDILKEAAQLSGLPKCKEVFASVGVDRLGNIADNAEKLTELINALAPFAREAD